ncbi:MAG: hypothetical protein CMJ58_13305 [Planctomycetaceae bacterium]|nr:hypothetical protein [Planctomycetaceae bacterium]
MSSNNAAAPPIEMDVLIDRCMGNLDLMQRVVTAFVDHFPDDLTALEEALQSGVGPDVAAIAHRMKGSASSVAANALAAEIAAVECAARTSDGSEELPTACRLREEWDRILATVS